MTEHTEFQTRSIQFAKGQWQRTQPTTKGWYPTMTRDGLRGADIFVMADGHAIEEWAGWWWSEPRPPMPKAPVW